MCSFLSRPSHSRKDQDEKKPYHRFGNSERWSVGAVAPSRESELLHRSISKAFQKTGKTEGCNVSCDINSKLCRGLRARPRCYSVNDPGQVIHWIIPRPSSFQPVRVRDHCSFHLKYISLALSSDISILFRALPSLGCFKIVQHCTTWKGNSLI